MLSIYWKRQSDGHQSGSLQLDESADLVVKLSAGFSQTTIIIDALDECNHDTRGGLLSRLKKIVTSTEHVRIFLTGRCDGDIKRMLRNFPNHYINATDNTKDIKTYINSEIERCFKEELLPDVENEQEFKSEIIRALEKGAHGMYVFAWFYLE